MCKLVLIQDAPISTMMRAGAANAPALAIGAIFALHHIASPIPEAGDTVEIRAEVAGRIGDDRTWREVISPRVAVDGARDALGLRDRGIRWGR